MIKNIIFDIGNVLVDFCWMEFLLRKGFSPEMAERIGNASVNSPTWAELDRGVWSLEELLQGFAENDPEIAEQLRQAYTDMTGIVRMRDYACDWVKELKEKGFGVYYLSNYSYKVENECREQLQFLPLMDGGILSYKEHLVKPDAAIYRLLLKRYGLQAEECIFLDDTAVNIEAACKEGIHGIVFGSREQALHDMEQIISGNTGRR